MAGLASGGVCLVRVPPPPPAPATGAAAAALPAPTFTADASVHAGALTAARFSATGQRLLTGDGPPARVAVGGRLADVAALRHVSSVGAFHDFECNWRSKSSDIVLDMAEVRLVLGKALDDIGCRDGFCDVGGGRYARLAVGIIEQAAIQWPLHMHGVV